MTTKIVVFQQSLWECAWRSWCWYRPCKHCLIIVIRFIHGDLWRIHSNVCLVLLKANSSSCFGISTSGVHYLKKTFLKMRFIFGILQFLTSLDIVECCSQILNDLIVRSLCSYIFNAGIQNTVLVGLSCVSMNVFHWYVVTSCFVCVCESKLSLSLLTDHLKIWDMKQWCWDIVVITATRTCVWGQHVW